MRPLSFLAVIVPLLAPVTVSAAGPVAHLRKATVAPPASAASCLNHSGLFSHAAYIPTAPDNVAQCGHLLSTDTLLKVHHWSTT